MIDSDPNDIPVLEDDALVIPIDVLERIRRLFEFLRLLEEQRTPARRDLDTAEWSLFLAEVTSHPTVRTHTSAGAADARRILALRRPELTDCPTPPESLQDWLNPGWEDPASEDEVLQPTKLREARRSELLREDVTRAKDAKLWLGRRTSWARNERPARVAAELFDRTLALWARLQREGERFRLLLGEGYLIWQREDGLVRHPLLVQEVELRFDEAKRELEFLETGAPPSLYADLLAGFPELDGEKRKAIRAVVEEALEKGELSPLQEASEEGILRTLEEMLGVPRSNGSIGEELDGRPRLVRNAVLFLVPRVTGMGAVYENFLQRLHQLAALPKGLALVVGDDSASPPQPSVPAEETELYFTKPANDAQQRIARRIDATGAVLVQGPPGTGKTHTIANLIGHFLAQGKTVLVTAQTSRALRVLRDQVVEPLKPLCVSVLDSDADSRAELESAINTIVAKLNHSAAEYDRAAEAHERQRKLITRSLEQRQRKLREALEAEVTELTAGELKLSPNEAARRLASGVGKDDWILGPLSPKARLPINDDSIRALYKLNAELTPADEGELRQGVPNPDDLLSPEELAQLSATLGKPLEGEAPVWGALSDKVSAERLNAIATKLRALVDELEPRPKWAWSCVQAMLLGGGHTAPWDELIERMESTGPQIAALRHSLVEHEVRLDVTMDPDEELPVARELLTHVSSGGNLGWLTLTANAPWKRLLEKCPVNGRRAETERDVRAIHDTLCVEQLRRQLRRRWDVLLGQEGFPLEGEDRLTVEETALSALPELRQSVRWAREEWPACLHQLEVAGIPWTRLLDSTKAKPPHAELRRVLVCARTQVLPGLEHDVAANQRRGEEMKRIAARERLERFPRSTPARKALAALESLNVEAYQEAAAEIVRLSALLGPATKRERLLSALWASAPTWAERIRARIAPHQGPEVPGDIARAWEHRMIAEALDRRSTQDVDQLQKEIAQLTQELQETTSLAVENRAWAAQARRTDRTQHRALMSWLDVVKRLGKGHSKRAEEYRASARRQLETARAAVPVWIMPLSRVAESFGPDQPLFDVVILDEASQCDVSALVAFSLGQRVVVVGDDEQVSPSAIGEGTLDVRELQREWLDGFPDQDLFDGRASAYEIARRSFPGGLIRLTEHFRCVPDIIRFSNALCYDGEIKPLREAASGHVFPAVVAHQVLGGERGAGSKVNRAEALEVASLVVAVTEEPAYKGLELGVISLLGGEQAKEIDSLLQRFLDPATYHARRLVCGTAPHFQGDERDVMFVSLVDSGADKGTLRLVERDDLKKRYNVAVSRARDQLWVVHSLNPDKDLKADDLRRKLIEHATNPQNTPRAETPAESSDLAEEIRKRLKESGYFVESDLDVGAYQVHLVVTGANGRVAIQCDGEQTSLTDLDSELAQEAVLARLGWSFIRLRGSAYYRDPDGELLRLMQKLEERGIKAGNAGEASLRPAVRDEGLVGRVLERAAEIRKTWIKNAAGFDALFAAKRLTKAARAKAALNAQRTEPHLLEPDTERNLTIDAG